MGLEHFLGSLGNPYLYVLGSSTFHDYLLLVLNIVIWLASYLISSNDGYTT